MSSFHQREALIPEPFPCPDCGETAVQTMTETFQLSDGFSVKKLSHFKCSNCGSRFFTDQAIHQIQAARQKEKRLLKKVA